MIREIVKIINDKKFDNIVEQLSNVKTKLHVQTACPQIAPLLALAVPRPFVYVTPSETEPALEVFQINNSAEAFIRGETDILVVPESELMLKVPISKSETLSLSKNQTHPLKDLLTKLIEFGYDRVDKPFKRGEFAMHGDTIDVWQDEIILRLIFFGDVIEDIKTLDPKTYLSVQKLEKAEIPSVAIRGDFVDLFESIKGRKPTLIFDRVAPPPKLAFPCVVFDDNASPLSISTSPIPNYHNAFSALVPDIIRKVEKENKTAIVFADSRAISSYMIQKKVPFVETNLEKVERGKINVIYKNLGTSFELLDYDIVIYSTTSRKSENPVILSGISNSAFTLPTVGQVVVHSFHGLGRYLGIKKLKLDAAEEDYILLQYDGGAFVYVRPDQADKVLSNYTGEPTRLSKIGGKDFAEAKQRVRRRIRELKFNLSSLYAKRLRTTSNAYDVPPEVLHEFSEAFAHLHTKDQKTAIEAVIADMSSDRIMDRLLCGDVGYGKTEVALHAAFIAVMSGYQVAMLAPTTILSVQHYNTAKERLAKFGISVEFINRFKTPAEQKQIIADLKDGKIDMIIGTHRLISNDIEFRGLGLLVLDEEQRFGVGAKEQIKRNHPSVDVLTLTATPIPRTLNMALAGIRDINIISTPPTGRLSVKTYVTKFDKDLAKEALLREYARGGQSIILFNNVSRIQDFTKKIRDLVSDTIPNARIAIAHGQMSATTLENTIIALYNKEIDILVASTIVENGIDVRSANTLIVTHADKLGVAQMHQLRGRVGRRTEQAYAYFTYEHNEENLSTDSTERLLAIRNYSTHGSGIEIAMRDLEIRGAGDLLGAEQSGHIAQIGFHEYCKILDEEIT